MARKSYTTESNTEAGRVYRAAHRESYSEYQRQYQSKHYGSATIRLTQVRQNIRKAKIALEKWLDEEQRLIKQQIAEQEAERQRLAQIECDKANAHAILHGYN